MIGLCRRVNVKLFSFQCIEWLNSKSFPAGFNKTFIESDPTLMMKRIIKHPKAGHESDR